MKTQINVMLETSTVEDIEDVRGLVPRGVWIREAILKELRYIKHGGKKA